MNFLIWPMMPSFVCIATSGLMFVVKMETYALELPHIFNENGHFQKLSHLKDIYLLFLKIQIESVESQAEYILFQNRARHLEKRK